MKVVTCSAHWRALFKPGFQADWLPTVQKLAPQVLHWDWKTMPTDVQGAMRLIMGVWRDSPALQRRFCAPFRSSPGEPFHVWIQQEILKRHGKATHALSQLEAAFLLKPHEIIIDHFVHDYKLRQKYPLGLLREGRVDFAKWLLKHGTMRFEATAEDTLWFLHAAESDESSLVELSRALTPAWQDDASHAPMRLRRVVERLNKPSSTCTSMLVMGHFTFRSGLQRSAQLSVDALQRAGERVDLRNIPILQGRDLSLRGVDFLGEEHGDVSLLHVTPDPYYLASYERAGLLARPEIKRIAHYAWELPEPPQNSRPLPHLQEIWVYSRFVADSLKSWKIPVLVLPPAMPPVGRDWQPAAATIRRKLGLDADTYVFLYVFDASSTLERKNPQAVIKAFLEAVRPSDRACLVLKAARGNHYPEKFAEVERLAGEAGVMLLTEMLSYEETQALIASCDCYVSLHRSEGFGFTMAEAMQYAKPVIATAYSGNMDYMNDHNSYLVSWSHSEVPTGTLTYPAGSMWAEPDPAHAAALMREVLDHRDEARAKGIRAGADIRHAMSPDAIAQQMAQRLHALRSHP